VNAQLKNIFNQHLVVVISVVVALAVYSKFLFFGHISWDDPEMVFKNRDVRDFNLKALLGDHYVGNYIPVTMFFHAVTWFLFGNGDWGHHLLNILCHVFNGILVYQLGRRIFKNDVIANIGTVIFLLHPLQVESVGWISELKNVLSTTFYLASLLYYLDFKTGNKKTSYFLCLLLFIPGCLSKSSVVVLPLTFIALDVLIDRSFSMRSLIDKLPFVAVSVIIGIINIRTQTADQFINYSHAFPYPARTGFAGFALLKYLVLFLVPANLSVIYPYPEVKISVFVSGGIFLLVIFGLLYFTYKKKHLEVFYLILFILFNLILVLQFLPFGEVLYADRYMYVPIIGFAWLTGLFISKIKIPVKAVSLVFVVIFSVLTFSRAGAWSSAIHLYEDIIKKYPDQFIALNSAGVESMFMNNDEKSLDYFNRAIKASPSNYKGYYNRGLLYIKNNKPELAIKTLNEAIGIYDYRKAYVARASAYYMLKDLPKAMNDANHVLEKEPDNAKAHLVLGNCYNDLNKLEEAMTEYNKCIELNVEEPEYYFKRAIVFGKKQDFNSCLSDLELCISMKPDYYEAYYWRGVAKVNLRKNPCEDFKIAAQNNFEPAIPAFNKYCR
jgi:protein O-mannosyl-transferase